MPRLEDYPYDPHRRILIEKGLDKLRAIEDPKLREQLFALWATTRNEKPVPTATEQKMVPRRECLDDESDSRFP